MSERLTEQEIEDAKEWAISARRSTVGATAEQHRMWMAGPGALFANSMIQLLPRLLAELRALRQERDEAIERADHRQLQLDAIAGEILYPEVPHEKPEGKEWSPALDNAKHLIKERDALRTQLAAQDASHVKEAEETEEHARKSAQYFESLWLEAEKKLAAQLVELSKLGNVAWVQLGNHPGLPDGVRAILQAVQDAGMRAARAGGQSGTKATCATDGSQKTDGGQDGPA